MGRKKTISGGCGVRVLRSSKGKKEVYYGPKKIKTKSSDLSNEKKGTNPQPQHTSPKRGPTLTQRRKAKITEFVTKSVIKPEIRHGSYGSDMWIKGLLRHMDERGRYAANNEIVKYWLNCTDYFQKTLWRIRARVYVRRSSTAEAHQKPLQPLQHP